MLVDQIVELVYLLFANSIKIPDANLTSGSSVQQVFRCWQV